MEGWQGSARVLEGTNGCAARMHDPGKPRRSSSHLVRREVVTSAAARCEGRIIAIVGALKLAYELSQRAGVAQRLRSASPRVLPRASRFSLT